MASKYHTRYMSLAVVLDTMVEKITLFELHLDDAHFSNAVGGTPEEATAMLEELDATDADVDEPDEMSTDDLESSERSVGRTLGRLAVLVVLAVGVRTVARRMLASDDEGVEDDADEDSVAVDLDDRVEA